MGIGFKSGAGGVNPLNFLIVGGSSQPENPKENTIWINTETKIKGWYFSATQPENMAEGEVWIHCGNTSNVAFNALKKNTLQVYPMHAKQLVSGALYDLTAKTYQNGAWVDWVVEFFVIPGDIFDNVNGATKQNDGSYQFNAAGSGSMVVSFDATEYKSMTIKGIFQGYKGKLCIGLFSSASIYAFQKGYSNDFADGGGTIDETYDISESGNVFVGVCGQQDHEDPQYLDCTITSLSFKT